MDQQPRALASILVSAAARFSIYLVNLLREQIAIDTRTYQPEKYYMRGPGPKWREKHMRQASSALQ
jgi:hypothetical protein